MDAIQSLTGCTFGKGNLIFHDYGKGVYTFMRRSDNKAIRIVTKPEAWGEQSEEYKTVGDKVRAGKATEQERARFWELHEARSQELMNVPEEKLFEVRAIDAQMPKRARIHTSLACENCGEQTMETRIRRFRGRNLCITCFEAAEAR